ncbi:uncharacterized protein B0H64DRAFT_89495 [Chaetomium fimeti]|uniref:Uncharacterized protein n=1 Tax=Chaetomium fimeti TaxID=1854472 RepID=A0AAE0HNU6_9PEZI|nr:hypothetical protein B0H64DRAFT_89495 [Chaetomium fimeti]
MFVRTNKQAERTSRISKSLTKSGSDLNASKSRLNKSQKEDRELEELSAFFSRKPSRREETQAEEQEFADHDARLRSIPRDIEYPFRLTRHSRCGSSHGSQQSDGSITMGESGGIPRYSSSLPAARNRDSGSITRSRASDKLDTGSTWSQPYDNHQRDVISGSCSSRRARARRSITEVPDHTLRHHSGIEPKVAAKAGKRLPEGSLDAVRGTRKDAAAQTDLSPKARNTLPCQSQRSDEFRRVVDHTRDEHRCNAVASSRENMEKASQVPIFVGEQGWLVPKVSRNAPHIEHEIECPRVEEVGILSRGVTTRLRDAGSFLYPPIQPAERLGHAEPTRPNNTYESQPRTNYADAIPESFGAENLEEFIRRIEDEAAMAPGETGDDPALRYGEVEMPDHPTPRPPMLSKAADFDATGDAIIMSNRDWFAAGSDLLTPDFIGDSASFSQTDFVRPTSLSLLESYPTAEREYPRTVWQRGNMFQFR